MLEIPECYTLARQMNDRLTGKKVTRVEVNHTLHDFAFFNATPEQYQKKLAGHVVTDVKAFGGVVELRMDGVSLGFSQSLLLRLCRANEAAPTAHQFYMEFDDGSRLVGCVLEYGWFAVYADGEEEPPHHLAAKKALSLLDEAYDFAAFRDLIDETSSRLPVKSFLLTEQRFPGLGSGVMQDILWNAGVHPKQKMHLLNKDNLMRLFLSMKMTLGEMAALNGRDSEKDLFGLNGKYKTKLGPATMGSPCPVCGVMLERANFMGSTIYWCPCCQSLI